MKLLRLFLILALACSAGCIKLTQTLTLEADGSGTIPGLCRNSSQEASRN